jgi:DNA repair exonuclease SbcCD ATPase subunit
LADVKKSQWKTTEENDKLMKLRDKFGELKEELEAQRKLLHSIEHILEGLKAGGSSLDKAVMKIETSTRNNALNVRDILYFVR